MTGRISAVKSAYGFITGDDGRSYFWHESDLLDDFDPAVDDQVTFEVVEPEPEKGRRAKNVAYVGRAAVGK